MSDHDRELSRAFDGQAEQFERAPVQTDPAALGALVAFAALPPGARLLDAGCGPGIVAEAFLAGGHSVHGVDLSPEMVRRARQRCEGFGEHARFEVGSVLDLRAGPFEAAVSRLVVHHVEDPLAFVRAQVALVAPRGVVIVSDHTTDPEPERARWHHEIERARDRTHVRTLTAGELVDVLARAGLEELRLLEEPFELDFDEWFDRGTPTLPKDEVRRRVLAGRARGFEPVPRDDGGITLRCVRALVRGVRPAA
ncbi:class I SAM-dependent methyltransferase [Anaeromyxobacter terrae]|uniref:class I SAM-dependent methyltransferase n=1 Tax=Anaeromyxobacter terrae TaxID=2925406 RepID=UPI001F575874|nr:class I SAM-dependent methyltransferase [Anaeromyxobacter sp. SG22]